MSEYNFLRFGNEVFDAIRAVNPKQLGIVSNTQLANAGVTPGNLADFVAALNRICECSLETTHRWDWLSVSDVCETLAEELGPDYNADCDGLL